MKIAIHDRPGSFSDRWVAYCREQQIPYKVVNCYENDIFRQIEDCDALMWHHHHMNKDVLFAQQLLNAVELSGKKVFPDFNTSWHFDDKIAQKYLFETFNIPMVETFIFYDKDSALKWVEKTNYPKVFKLSNGSGSANVKLIKTKKQGTQLVKRAFGKGFKTFDGIVNLKDKWEKYRRGAVRFERVIRAFGRLFMTTSYAKLFPRKKGYVYFQEFIKNEGYDIRVVVIGDKAVALKRLVRENDFRASGSANLVFENENIDIRFIKESFELAKKLKTQSVAIDLIKDLDNRIYVVEISYAFPMLHFLDAAAGYWDDSLNWHEEDFNLQGWMVELMLNKKR